MNILAIETTGPYCSVALLDDREEISEMAAEEKMGHLKNLTPMIEATLDRAGLYLEDLDAIAVSVGPGSFTGIRIGVTTARALSQASGVPLLAIPSLYAFGWGACEEGLIVCPLLDARRGQVYAGCYMTTGELIPAGPYLLEDFLEALDAGRLAYEDGSEEPLDNILFIGDGAMLHQERLQAWAEETGRTVGIEEEYQNAGSVAEFAYVTFDEANLLGYEDLHPEYMRIPEAERNRLEKEKVAGDDQSAGGTHE